MTIAPSEQASTSMPTITAAGYAQLSAELDHLRTVARAELAEQLRDVRTDGDLPDNPGLLDMLEQQALLEHRIVVLAEHLSRARVATVTEGTAGVGSDVSVRDLDTDELMRLHLVGELEADPMFDRISVSSPIGEALAGRGVGAVVEAVTPRGTRRLRLEHVDARG